MPKAANLKCGISLIIQKNWGFQDHWKVYFVHVFCVMRRFLVVENACFLEICIVLFGSFEVIIV